MIVSTIASANHAISRSSLMLKIGTTINGTQDSIEALSTKVGMVLLILGVMHFFNLAVFNRLRNAKLNEARFASVNSNATTASVSRFRKSFGDLEE